MALISCPHCGNPVSENAAACPSCGHPLQSQGYPTTPAPGYNYAPQQSSGNSKNLIIIGLIVAILVLGAVLITYMLTSRSNNDYTSNTTADTVKVLKVPGQSSSQLTTAQTEAAPEAAPAPAAHRSFDAGDYYDVVSSRRLSSSDIRGLSREQIGYLRNLIYAKHGYIFKKSKYQNYFNRYGWYSGYETEPAAVSRYFNSVENANVSFLKRHE